MFHHPAAGQRSSVARFLSCLGYRLSEGISSAALEISRVSVAFVPATFRRHRFGGVQAEDLQSEAPHLLWESGIFSQMLFGAFVIAWLFPFLKFHVFPPGLLWPSLILLSFLGASNLLLEPFTCFSDQRIFQSEFGKKLFLVSLYQKHVALCYQTTSPSSFLARFIQICTQAWLKQEIRQKQTFCFQPDTAFRSPQFKFQPFLIKSSSNLIKPARFPRISC